jgi:hypothetical protein
MSELKKIQWFRHFLKKHQRGGAAIEFALLALMFFIIVFSVLEIARAVYLFNTLQEVTRRAASYAANSDFDSGSQAEVRRRALFGSANGRLILGAPVTSDHIKIDYLSINGGAGSGSLTTQRVSTLPSCPAENMTNCLTNPYGASCIRLVQVRICNPGDGGDCTPVPYQALFPLMDLSMIRLPRATTIVPAQTLGNKPGALSCE